MNTGIQHIAHCRPGRIYYRVLCRHLGETLTTKQFSLLPFIAKLLKCCLWGPLRGRVVKFAGSAAGAQGSDPGRGQGTARQATLRRCPTSHNQNDLQIRYTTVYRAGVGEIKSRKKEKKRLATAVSPGANLKKKKSLFLYLLFTLQPACIQLPSHYFTKKGNLLRYLMTLMLPNLISNFLSTSYTNSQLYVILSTTRSLFKYSLVYDTMVCWILSYFKRHLISYSFTSSFFSPQRLFFFKVYSWALFSFLFLLILLVLLGLLCCHHLLLLLSSLSPLYIFLSQVISSNPRVLDTTFILMNLAFISCLEHSPSNISNCQHLLILLNLQISH